MKPRTPVESLALLTQLAAAHPEEFERAARQVCAGRPELIRGIRILGQSAEQAANRAEAELETVLQKTPGLEKIAQIRLRIRRSRIEAGQGALRHTLLRVRTYLIGQKSESDLQQKLTRPGLSQPPKQRGDRDCER